MKIGWLASGAAGLALLASAMFGPAAAENLTIQGSTTFNTMLLASHRPAIEAASGHSLAVIPNKSSLGLVALMEGRADLAMISTSLQSEVAALRKQRAELPFAQLRTFTVSRTRVAFAIHPANPVRSADVESIKRVLRGEIDNWKMLGGPDLPLRVVMVRDGGGVTLTVENVLLRGDHLAARNPITVVMGSEVPKVVAREPGALGLAQLVEVQARKLPELVIDAEIEQQLNLVTLGNPSSAAWDVILAMQNVAAKELHAAK
jgi:phosphate transport system substrate-binding protein